MGAPRALRAPQIKMQICILEADGPAGIAVPPSHGSNNPSQEEQNAMSNITDRPKPAMRFDPNALTPKADALRIAAFASLEGPILQAKGMAIAASLLAHELYEDVPDDGHAQISGSSLNSVLFLLREAEGLIVKVDDLYGELHDRACIAEQAETMVPA